MRPWARSADGDAMLATGFARADVEDEFLRARRHQVMAALAHRLGGGRADADRMLVLDEVVGALGRRGQRYLGLRMVRLDTIVGTAESRSDFDRRFRPTSDRVRSRWEQVALAQRRGDAAGRPVPRGRPAFRAGRSSPGVGGRGDRPAGDRGLRNRGAHRRAGGSQCGSRSSFPVVRREARSSCALAAFASGYLPPMRTVSRPSSIQRSRSPDRCSSSSRRAM